KKTLGEVIKTRREALCYTQRELASKLGVKASHIAYLENGRRRPSLSLISRIADTMGLDRQQLFLLTHPEARALINARRDGSARRSHDQVWREFAGNHALLRRFQVKPRELRVLSQVNMLGRVTTPRQFLFILNSIRQAVDEER
ncbi:MAG: helix-turn-helix domain-containing protein, partial [Candidatus Binataceae bacterium]